MRNINKYQLYRLEKKHLHDVRYVILKAFGKKINIDYLSHKYDSSYLGIETVATIAYEGQKPVAFYGAIPQLFKLGNEKLLLAHACDSYTLPQYQKQGLHFNLASKSYELMQAEDIKMVYAYHSENTYYSTKKLNWKEHVHMNRFHILNGTLPVSKVCNRLNLNSLLMRRFKSVFRPYITSPTVNPVALESRMHQDYSSSFFNYKDGLNKHFTILINDCLFYLKVRAIIEVGFLGYNNVENLPGAIDKLKRLAAKCGINEILFQVDPTTKQFDGLTSISEGKPSWLIGYLPFDDSLDISKFGFNYADLDTF